MSMTIFKKYINGLVTIKISLILNFFSFTAQYKAND